MLGVSGFDRARKKDGRFGNAKVVGLRVLGRRSKKINANDDVYTEEYALAA